MKSFFENNPVVAYLLGGSLASFIMALLRSGGFTRKNFRVRLSEAFMCSMLSSSLTMVAIHHFDANEYIAMPISVFCGFLGTDYLRALLIGFIEWLKSYFNINTDKKKDTDKYDGSK